MRTLIKSAGEAGERRVIHAGARQPTSQRLVSNKLCLMIIAPLLDRECPLAREGRRKQLSVITSLTLLYPIRGAMQLHGGLLEKRLPGNSYS